MGAGALQEWKQKKRAELNWRLIVVVSPISTYRISLLAISNFFACLPRHPPAKMTPSPPMDAVKNENERAWLVMDKIAKK